VRPLGCAAALLALLALGAGCSSSEPEVAPAACLAGPATYLRALRAAPGEVRLQGETPISECLTSAQEGGELANVGSDMVRAATELNRRAIEGGSGEAALEVGYLVGAAQRGAEETGGIHEDLIRRLNSAARFSRGGVPDAAFERSFGRGFAAGQESG
jgi:hypothetical protein